MRVIQSEELEPAPAAWLGERCELVRCAQGDPRFGALLADAVGLVVRTYTQVNDTLLEQAPQLRVVARAGVALENVDVAACRSRGVEVVHTPDANTRAVVDYVWSGIMSMVRPYRRLDDRIDSDRWHQIRRDDVLERQLCEMTLGVYGCGRIGRRVARVGRALEMRVIYHDLLEIPESERFGAEPVSREQLLSDADILTIHVDSRPSNRGLVGSEALSLAKPDALIINSSRGFVVDTVALAAHLRAHSESRAMLDVHEPEPPPQDYPVWQMASAIITPHEAAATTLARENMSWVVRDVWRVLNGQSPEFPAPELR